VKVARGTIKPVTGSQLVAKVKFKVKGTGTAPLTFANGSTILASSSNTNVLGTPTGATFTLK